MDKLIFYFFSSLLIFDSVYAEPLSVKHDPFEKPVLRKQHTSNTKKASSHAKPLLAKLSSTLRAGKNSMAIVDGQVIKLNEDVDGFKLIRVDERSVVFLKGNQQTQLTLDDHE